MDSRSIVSGLFQANRQAGSETVTSYQMIEKDEVRSLPIDALIPSDINRELDHDFVTELANNIRMNGLMQYPVVKPIGDGTFTILAGHHRIAACKKLKEADGSYQTVRCLIKRSDDIDSELLLLDTNLQINTLSVYDKVMAIGRKEELLKEKKKRDHAKGGNLKHIIAEESGLKRSQIQTYLTVYKKAIPEVKEALRKEKITLTQAVAISQKPANDQLKAVMKGREKVSAEKNTEACFQKTLDTTLTAYVKANHELDRLLQKAGTELTPQQEDLKRFVHEMVRFLEAFHDV